MGISHNQSSLIRTLVEVQCRALEWGNVDVTRSDLADDILDEIDGKLKEARAIVKKMRDE